MAGSPSFGESVGGGGGGGRGCTGNHSFQLPSGPVSLLWRGGYSMGTHPFFSPRPSTGRRPGSSPRFPLMRLSTSPPLEYCSLPLGQLCFLVSQADSAPSKGLETSQAVSALPRPPSPGTNLWSRGLGAQPPSRRPLALSRGLTFGGEDSCPAPTQASQFLVTVPVVQMFPSVLDRLFRTPTYCYTLLCIWRFLRFV